jgi:bacteriorhodopsin
MWMMRTRGILVVVSVLGVAATLIAVIEGAWIYALAFYGISVAGIAVLLGRAVRQHRARVQPGEMSSHS